MRKSSFLVKHVVFLLIAVFAAGCVHTPGGVAPSTTPLNGRNYIILGDAEGTDSYVLLFYVIPIFGSNSTEKAIKDAIESENGDALIEVTVDTTIQWWVLFIRQVIRVKGKAIKFTS